MEVKRTVIGDIDVADMILSHAADASSDFIVMGATATHACANSCSAA